MNARERWKRTFRFEQVDRVPNYEFGYWHELYAEWHAQGLPENIKTEGAANEYFGLDKRWTVGPKLGLLPPFTERTLREEGGHRIYQNAEGITCEVNSDGGVSIPHFLDYPIKDRASWERFKERLDPAAPGRVPDNLDDIAQRCNNAEIPVGINIGSMFGKPRDWAGFEQIAMLVYDDPDLVDEIVENQCQLVLQNIRPFLERIHFDYAAGWEDFCFNNGPIISPDMIRQFLLPRYKRIADLLRQYGVEVIYTDCDGDIKLVAPLWLEAGYNCMFPLEVRGGSDPVELRRRYGKDILLLGGFDKMAFLGGKPAILAELKRLTPIIEEGGFVPHVDHRVPCGVKLEDYLYYHKEKRAVLGYQE